MAARWDGDERGQGIADAARLLPGAGELVSAFSESRWVAEEPRTHLLPHVEAWCQQDSRLELTHADVDRTAALILDLRWRGPTDSVGQARAAVFSLVGSFAESATYVRQRRVMGDADGCASTLRFEVGTGELAPEARFAPHGHVVVIDVLGVL